MTDRNGREVDVGELITALKDPVNIEDARYANTLYVLTKVFERDTLVNKLLNADAALVETEVANVLSESPNNPMPEISLTCFAWILWRLNPERATEVLKPLFVLSMKLVQSEGGLGFFSHFAAHVIRGQEELPIKPEDWKMIPSEEGYESPWGPFDLVVGEGLDG